MQNLKLKLLTLGVVALSVWVLAPQQELSNQPDESTVMSPVTEFDIRSGLQLAENTECNPRVRVCEQD